MAASTRQDQAQRIEARRPALLAPVNGLLSRLPTSARLVALVLLLLVPTAVANVAYTQVITGQLNFSLAERDGVQVLRPALVAMAGTMAGRTPDLAAVGAAVAAQPKLSLDKQWQAVQTAGRTLATAGAQGDTTTATARTALVSALTDLVTEAGNSSNLILDPDLDSFYVMDSLVVQVPKMLLTAAQSTTIDRTTSHTDQMAAQAVRAGTLAGGVQSVVTDVKTATAKTADSQLAGRLTALGRATEACTELATQLTSSLANPRAANPTAVGSAAVSAVPNAVTALDELLKARTERLSHSRLRTLVISLVALLLACWFGAGVWWRTRQDVGLVLGAVTAIAENNLDPHPVPEGQEEFGGIGRALAVARHQLGETQRALTLSQAAREEQMRANFAQQRSAERQARERAQEVIDSTAGTVISELGDIGAQVEAVRVAASTIDGRVTAADTAARSVVEQAKEADQLVSALAGSLDQVAGMAQLIAGIADQTRLLALNATIESARAGEAGRGFSVVAQEVKNLAVTTARSTEQITHTIASLQRDAEAVATSITTMGQCISGVDEATEVLANVATEQHLLVEHLDQRVTDVRERVSAMSQLTEKLERRAHERIPTVGDIQLRFAGRVTAATLTDISIGGLKCQTPAGDAPGQGGLLEVEVQLVHGMVTVPGRVARAQPFRNGVQVGIEFFDVPPLVTQKINDHVAALLS